MPYCPINIRADNCPWLLRADHGAVCGIQLGQKPKSPAMGQGLKVVIDRHVKRLAAEKYQFTTKFQLLQNWEAPEQGITTSFLLRLMKSLVVESKGHCIQAGGLVNSLAESKMVVFTGFVLAFTIFQGKLAGF